MVPRLKVPSPALPAVFVCATKTASPVSTSVIVSVPAAVRDDAVSSVTSPVETPAIEAVTSGTATVKVLEIAFPPASTDLTTTE